MNNEADHVQDPVWASEARRYARRQTWHHTFAAFGLGLVIMQGVVLFQVLKMPLMQQLAVAGQDARLWTNLTDIPLLIAAFFGAWLLGRQGYRAWPVALGFGLFQGVKMWTQLMLQPAYDAGLSPVFGVIWEGRPNALTPQALGLWLVLGLLGYFGVVLGRRQQRRPVTA